MCDSRSELSWPVSPQRNGRVKMRLVATHLRGWPSRNKAHRRRLFFFFFLGQRTNSLPSPPLPSPPLPLKVGPLNTARRSGDRCKLPRCIVVKKCNSGGSSFCWFSQWNKEKIVAESNSSYGGALWGVFFGALKTQVLENASTEKASTKQRISQGWKTHVRKTQVRIYRDGKRTQVRKMQVQCKPPVR